MTTFTGDRLKDSIDCPRCGTRMEPLYNWRNNTRIGIGGWQCTNIDCYHVVWNKDKRVNE